MSHENIQTARDGGVLTVTIDRPERKNALTGAMYTALTEALHEAENNPEIRVTVVEGNGGLFTSGNDIADFMSTPPAGPDSPVLVFLLALIDAKKPLVGKVRGPAIGIGTTMLLHMDLCYADETARFQMPFVPLGLCPEGASSLLLPRAMGFAQATDLLMFGEKFDADTAVARGVITEKVSSSELDARVQERANKIASLAPASVRATKELLRGPLRERTREVLLQEGAMFIERVTSEEAAEAFGAFFEKRAPDFSRFS